MGAYFPHLRVQQRPRRTSWAAPAAPTLSEDTVARREQIARERDQQAKHEAEKRARLIARRQERESRRAEDDRIESMAREATFPWEPAESLLTMLEKSGITFNHQYPFTARALFWACELIFDTAADAGFRTLAGQELTASQKLLRGITCPLTLDPERIQPVINFIWTIYRSNGGPAAEAEYCAAAAEYAHGVAEYRRTQLHGIEELTPGWFLFVDLLPTPAVFCTRKRVSNVSAGAALARRNAP